MTSFILLENSNPMPNLNNQFQSLMKGNIVEILKVTNIRNQNSSYLFFPTLRIALGPVEYVLSILRIKCEE